MTRLCEMHDGIRADRAVRSAYIADSRGLAIAPPFKAEHGGSQRPEARSHLDQSRSPAPILHHFLTIELKRLTGRAKVPRCLKASGSGSKVLVRQAKEYLVETKRNRRRTDRREPISFGRAYAQSDTFRALFKEGMRLVEETADYLDGAGRLAAKGLPRPASIVYATESMRLTTRLMQLASWLLLHRSVREGDMTLDRAREEKRKIRLEQPSTSMSGLGWDELPEEFRALVSRSLHLRLRVERIDTALLEESGEAPEPNAVNLQLKQLAAALNAGS